MLVLVCVCGCRATAVVHGSVLAVPLWHGDRLGATVKVRKRDRVHQNPALWQFHPRWTEPDNTFRGFRVLELDLNST